MTRHMAKMPRNEIYIVHCKRSPPCRYQRTPVLSDISGNINPDVISVHDAAVMSQNCDTRRGYSTSRHHLARPRTAGSAGTPGLCATHQMPLIRRLSARAEIRFHGGADMTQ